MSLAVEILTLMAEMEKQDHRLTGITLGRESYNRLCDEIYPDEPGVDAFGISRSISRAQLRRDAKAKYGHAGSYLYGLPIKFFDGLGDGFRVEAGLYRGLDVGD